MRRTLEGTALMGTAWRGAAAMLALAFAAPAWADDCAFRAPRNLDLASAGVKTLEVRARAGELEIRGEPGRSQVQVRGVACASREADLAQIRLVPRREGDRLVVAVEMPENNDWFGGQRTLDLELRVPARLALDVRDSSGEAEVRGVASLRMQDSSGELHIADIPGAVRVEDSSGELEVRNVGSLHVPHDSSGEIDVVGVRGDVAIDSDSSGGIGVRDIGGSVTVGSDSSGDIEVENVAGTFTVESDGSGGIEHRGVRGAVRIPSR